MMKRIPNSLDKDLFNHPNFLFLLSMLYFLSNLIELLVFEINYIDDKLCNFSCTLSKSWFNFWIQKEIVPLCFNTQIYFIDLGSNGHQAYSSSLVEKCSKCLFHESHSIADRRHWEDAVLSLSIHELQLWAYILEE